VKAVEDEELPLHTNAHDDQIEELAMSEIAYIVVELPLASGDIPMAGWERTFHCARTVYSEEHRDR
jgi:hypothetical protein